MKDMVEVNGDLLNVSGLRHTKEEVEKVLGFIGRIFWKFNKEILLYICAARTIWQHLLDIL